MAEVAWRTNVLNSLDRLQRQLQDLTNVLSKPQPAIVYTPLRGAILSRVSFPTDYAKEAKQILIDTDGHGQVDVLTLPSLPAGTNTIGNVNAIKSGTWNIDNLLNPHPVNVTNQIARDADGHGQVDVLTMPSISVSLEEKGFADANNVPTRALVDSDRHVQCDVLTMPSVSVSLEPPYPIYAVAVSASAVATSKHHLSIWNGSSSYVKIRKAAVSMHSTATVSGFIMQFIMQRADAVSGGTALTIVKFDNRDPNLPSEISAATGATVTLKEAPIAIFTLNPEETGSQGFIQFDVPKPIVVAPSEGITIQQYATAGVGLFNAVVYFTAETS